MTALSLLGTPFLLQLSARLLPPVPRNPSDGPSAHADVNTAVSALDRSSFSDEVILGLLYQAGFDASLRCTPKLTSQQMQMVSCCLLTLLHLQRGLTWYSLMFAVAAAEAAVRLAHTKHDSAGLGHLPSRNDHRAAGRERDAGA